MMQLAISGVSGLSEKMPAGIRALQELVNRKMIVPAFQPIVHAAGAAVFGYEILGRGTHSELPEYPGPLFRIAESVDNLPMQLSQMFRDVGIAAAATFDTKAAFFMNVHPDELRYARLLLLQMEKIRRDHPDMELVLEIHEKAVPSLADMKKICRELDGLNIKLAYDDFGAGQARFIELIEAPAHYLKFDMSLERDIDKAPPAKRSMVQSLVNLSKNMGILTLAEGLESEAEVNTCQDMGFDLIQGYYFGKPKIGSL
jgi:EAL domain-containing protein (putative c-di-GMP-specific phosphodiesterase class I)